MEEADARLEELESLYRNAPVGLSFIDCDLRYLRVNQVIADINGVSIDDMVGRSYRDFSPETAGTAEPFLLGLMEGGKPVRNLDVRARPPMDPEVDHFYLLSMEPVRNSQGEIIGWVTAVQDVTDLRRAEETAARQLRELEILYAKAPVGFCHLDPCLRIVHLNPLFARLCDPALGDPLGALAKDVLSGVIAAQILPEFRYVARTGRPSVGIEVRGRVAEAPKRDYTWMLDTHPLMAPDGELTGAISVLQDVSALADRQRAVETTRDRLVDAQRVARVGSWEWNLVEDELWWSRELYDLFGEDPSFAPTYVGFFERVHPEDRVKLRRQMDSALANDRPAWVTLRIVLRDGSERVLFSAVRLERSEGGLPARVLGTCQDVTEFDPRDPGSVSGA